MKAASKPVLKPRLKGLPKPKAAKAPQRASTARPKVWTGARKKISVSHLQLSLPGLGGVL